MNLPQQAIDEFKVAWKESFGEEIDDDQARIEVERLLTLHGIFVERLMVKNAPNESQAK